MFPIKTLQKMIEIVRANMKLSNIEDRLFYSLSHIEKLMKDDIEKANRWFGYYQRVGEDKGYWTLKDVIQWVKDEKGLNPIQEKYFIFSIQCSVICNLTGTYLIHAKSISEILYLVNTYRLKTNNSFLDAIIVFCQEIPEHDYHKYKNIFADFLITFGESEQIQDSKQSTPK